MELTNTQKALIQAIEDGNYPSLLQEISNLDDVNFFNDEGETPLALASLYWHDEFGIKILKLILDKGADINLYKEPGFSPLLNAVIANRPEIVAFLLINSANPNINHLPEDLPDINSTAYLFAYDKMLEISISKLKQKKLDKFKLDELERVKKIMDVLNEFGAKLYKHEIKPELS